MELYPVNLNIKNRLCVVIGGGKVGLRKAESLLEAGAQVKVISPEFHPELTPNSQLPTPNLIRRPYKKGDLKGAFIAVAATGNREVNKQVAVEAKKYGVLVNVADVPSEGDFFVPAVVKRNNLVISVSTSGKQPALSKKIKEELDKVIDKNADLRSERKF